ncbi:predicted protein [Uncinocarpus reesii 1704]|uniref:Nephrocystin 3-like N-terminal domain-containing protein n=1 Tax=Uncinocarpus reesii (strain UAMH 1704) TaxID=336963 RepID=C4JMX2_UNCRE|nr:uncharacterized protein UREG_04180 [Uncinocarpus reesii 1704]EEP79334.1 predicted protein [Uncinocarpus reesii 1704]
MTWRLTAPFCSSPPSPSFFHGHTLSVFLVFSVSDNQAIFIENQETTHGHLLLVDLAMEVAGCVMAAVQLTGAIVDICGGYLEKVKKAKEDIARLQQETSSLAKVLQMLHDLLSGPDGSNLSTSQKLFDDVTKCSSALEKLKAKIDPGRTQAPLRKFGLRAFKWPLERTGLTEAINDIKGYHSMFSLALQIDQVNTSNLIVKGVYDQRERDLLQALASDYEDYKDFNPSRVPGTCEWFFGDDRFCKWRDSNTSSLLWVSAGPGCGKSVLSRALIDEGRLPTNAAKSTVCYFFFKDGDERRMTAASALSAILHQLLTQDRTGLIKLALPSHKNLGKDLAQNLSELWRILIDCSQSHDTGEIVCVLDALDECNEDDRRRLIAKLKGFYCQHSDPSNPVSKLKFLITSRPYDDLERAFRRFSDTTTYVRFDGDEKSAQISNEINLVINAKVNEIACDFNENDRRTISNRLKSMEHRTYLWLHLTLNIIEQSPSEYGRRCDVETLLSGIPSQVSEAYEKILGRSKDPIKTETLLQIVLAAAVPLTLDQANLALTLALQKKRLGSYTTMESDTWPRKDFKTTVKNLCGLFVSVYDSKLSFIHQTAREFLIHPERGGGWQGRLDMSRSHGTMCRVSLTYLSYLGEPSIPIKDLLMAKLPLAWYSGQYWMDHARPVQLEKDVKKMILDFFLQQQHAYAIWCTLLNPEIPLHRYPRPSPYDMATQSPLYYAAYAGLQCIVGLLLESGADVNAQGGIYGNALQIASQSGEKEIVQLLLDSGADVNAQGGRYGNALQIASLNDNKEIVQLLLEHGADVNAQGGRYGNALQIASQSGEKEIVQLLLEHDADVNAQSGIYGNALQTASLIGNKKIVQLLLENGADVNVQSGEYGNALQTASLIGNKEIVQLLLVNGAVYGNIQQV